PSRQSRRSQKVSAQRGRGGTAALHADALRGSSTPHRLQSKGLSDSRTRHYDGVIERARIAPVISELKDDHLQASWSAAKSPTTIRCAIGQSELDARARRGSRLPRPEVLRRVTLDLAGERVDAQTLRAGDEPGFQLGDGRLGTDPRKLQPPDAR